MSKTHFVTMASLNRALDRVVPELERHGFWDDAVEKIDVWLVPVGGAYGWQHYGGSGESASRPSRCPSCWTGGAAITRPWPTSCATNTAMPWPTLTGG